MKVHHITEAPRIEPKIGGTGAGTAPSGNTGGAPLKGQSLKLNGVTYQWKGAAWAVTDTSEFKGRNPPNLNSLADNNAKELLNQKAAKVNGGSARTTTPNAGSADPKADAPKADGPDKKIKSGVWNKIKFGGKILKVLLGGTLGQIAVQYMNLANINSIVKEHYKIVGEHGYPSQQAKDSRRDMAWAITDIIVEGVGALAGALVSTYLGLIALAGIASTGIGFILLALIGAAGALGGAIGTSEVLKSVPGAEKAVHGFVVDILSKHVIDQPTMEEWGKANMSDPEFAFWYGMLYGRTAIGGVIGKTGEYFLDDIDNNDSITEQDAQEKFKKAAVKIVKSAPNGVENFNKGKELVRQAMAKQQAEKAKKADL